MDRPGTLAGMLLVLFVKDHRSAVFMFGAVLAYRHLSFPLDIGVGFILLQVAVIGGQIERPRDGATAR